ncbi:guanylate kinase [Niabella drilacis]|uniref:Guanylate kinase n=1 Tax=Niabella drilacis (strain DSM 25811 / CCM 8410 / CCUG 62505 / LMG 26954 / E90) TaxID=1285928 RepID=A0A1G6N2N9_NIADE|nr:guanylate kinase [Niabella drilacis]SDC62092.1 guanylate kinase [Niabella drilacis]
MIVSNRPFLYSPVVSGSGEHHKIIILTAPSGAGKTSITHHLLKKIPQLSFSISAATREARAGEVDGKDYYFITEEAFTEKIKASEFVEWEMVYEGKYYGTLKSELQRLWKQNRYPLLDIDVKGAIHVQQQYPKESLSVFIEPPSVKELRRRLISRGSESEESLQTRLNKAEYELSFISRFNKVVVNDDLEEACAETEALVRKFLNIPA